MKNDLTIVIPCKNEEKYIGQTLESISKQLGCSGVRVLIADAGSTDGTIGIINSLKPELDLRIQIIEGGSVSRGRNNGASLAETDYILFLDADATFTRDDAVLISVCRIKSDRLDCLSTAPVYRGEKDFRAKFLFMINKITTKILAKSCPFAVGAYTLIRKDKFDEIGGYDEDLMHTEDWWLSKKISPNKFSIIPDLVTQDNRRFRRFGYFRMVKMIFGNYLNRHNRNYFLVDQNYWK